MDVGDLMMQLEVLETNIPLLGMTWLHLLSSLLLLVIGIVVAKYVVRYFRKGLSRSKLPELVVEFLSRFLSVLLYVAVFLMFISSLGVQVDSVVLGLSAVIGLILGFGMQDTLTNLSSGIWIAALRPLDKGEFVSVGGYSGTVNAVGIMATELLSIDNQLITIPNKLVWNNSIVNNSRMPTRRASVDVGISYKADLDKAITVAMDLMRSHPKVLEEPSPAVVVLGLGDSSVDLQLRAWTVNADLWGVKWDLTGGIFKAFRENGIEIPYPQRDVHLKKE